ncbi:MAG: hypothetical protein ACMG6E_05750 [Candidatus Roizmanbacteria bacterium]
MLAPQIQLKISLSEQLNDLLKGKAQRLGVPVTQFVKYILLKEVESEQFPTYIASERLEKISEKASREIDKAVEATDIDELFSSL